MMRSIAPLALSMAVSAVAAYAENITVPVASSLEPKAGVPGTVLTVRGSQLDNSRIENIYLTDHRFDMMVKVLEQDSETVKIRIPPFAKPGRLQLLFLTRGERPVYLEQPFYVEIQDPADMPAAPNAPAAPVAIAKAAPPAAKPVLAKPVQVAAVVPASAPAQSALPPASRPSAPAPDPSRAAEDEPVSPVIKSEPKQQPVEVAQFAPAPPPIAPAAAAAPVAIATPAPTAAQAATRTPARLIKRSSITYPQIALNMKREGAVEVLITILPTGKVKDAKALSGDPLLRSAAEDCVMAWKYEPARKGSEPVESMQNVVVNFKLR